MLFISCRVFAGEVFNNLRNCANVIIVNVEIRPIHIVKITIKENAAFASFREDQKLMAVLAANGACVCAHRHSFQPKPCKGSQIGHEHLVIRMGTRFCRQVERVSVLHQEFAAPHHAETGAHFIAEFPLNMIKIARHILVRLDARAENIGDHFFIGGAKQHIPVLAILDAQHFLTIVIIAARLAPKIGRLQRWHQNFNGPGPVLFFAHNLLNLLENAKARGQP